MKILFKFIKFTLLSFILVIFSSSFILPNSTEFPSHILDDKYSSFNNGYNLSIYDEEENMIPPNVFTLSTGEISLTSKNILLTENQTYTFVFYIKDKDKLKNCTTQSDNFLTFNYKTPGVAEHKIDSITYSINKSTPSEFLNSSTDLTPSLSCPVFKLKDDYSLFFLSIYTNNIYTKNFSIYNFNLTFNKSHSCGLISSYQLYKGEISSYKGFKEFNHAPFGLNEQFIGPYKDKTVIDLSIPYKDNQISALDIKNSILAFDKGDYEYKNIDIITDAFTSSYRVLNTKLPIVFQAYDSLNNKSTITFNITIYDAIPPTITQLDDQIEISYKKQITKQEILSHFKIEDNYTLNVNTQIEGIDLNSDLKLGKHNIIITANDTSNNISRLETSFKIVDDVPPLIKGPSFINTNISTFLSKEDILDKFVVEDEIDKDLQIEIIEDNYSNNYNQVGEYLLTLESKDKSGNKVKRNVIINVVDNSGPVFYLNQTDLTMYQGDQLNLNNLVKSLVKNEILLSKNYTSVELINSPISEDNKLEVGEFNIVLKCNSDDNQTSFINLKLNVIQKSSKNSNNPFQNFINSIKEFFKNIFKKFNI